MAIDLTGLSSTPSANNRGKTEGLGQSLTGKNTPAQADTNGSSANTVKLSDEALSMQKLEEKVRDFPDIDMDKVFKVQKALDEGTYKVDANKLAANILNFEDQLFS